MDDGDNPEVHREGDAGHEREGDGDKGVSYIYKETHGRGF